jgi:hypothetical protein
MVGIGAAVSTTIGGLLIQHLRYRASFLRLAGIALLAFALLWFAVPETLPGTAGNSTSDPEVEPPLTKKHLHNNIHTNRTSRSLAAGLLTQWSGMRGFGERSSSRRAVVVEAMSEHQAAKEFGLTRETVHLTTNRRLPSPFAPYRYQHRSIMISTERIWNYNCLKMSGLTPQLSRVTRKLNASRFQTGSGRLKGVGEYLPVPQPEPGSLVRFLRHDRLPANSTCQSWSDSAPRRRMAVGRMGAGLSAS